MPIIKLILIILYLCPPCYPIVFKAGSHIPLVPALLPYCIQSSLTYSTCALLVILWYSKQAHILYLCPLCYLMVFKAGAHTLLVPSLLPYGIQSRRTYSTRALFVTNGIQNRLTYSTGTSLLPYGIQSRLTYSTSARFVTLWYSKQAHILYLCPSCYLMVFKAGAHTLLVPSLLPYGIQSRLTYSTCALLVILWYSKQAHILYLCPLCYLMVFKAASHTPHVPALLPYGIQSRRTYSTCALFVTLWYSKQDHILYLCPLCYLMVFKAASHTPLVPSVLPYGIQSSLTYSTCAQIATLWYSKQPHILNLCPLCHLMVFKAASHTLHVSSLQPYGIQSSLTYSTCALLVTLWYSKQPHILYLCPPSNLMVFKAAAHTLLVPSLKPYGNQSSLTYSICALLATLWYSKQPHILYLCPPCYPMVFKAASHTLLVPS